MGLRIYLGAAVVVFALSACSEKEQETTQTPKAQTAVTEQVQQTSAEIKAVVTEVAANHVGKKIHDSNCISCHDTAVYTRDDRRVKDFPKLIAQVRLCDANLGTSLFDEEIEQVADYLNTAYYQFSQ